MFEAEEERRYYEEQRYRQRTRQLPLEDYYEEEEYDEHYDNDGYDYEYVDVEATEGNTEKYHKE
jgi:hypothetical protein